MDGVDYKLYLYHRDNSLFLNSIQLFMCTTHDKLTSGMLNLFPNQIKVYHLPPILKKSHKVDSSLLHQHFREPPSEEILEKLAKEIAIFLNDRCPESVYSF